MTTHPTTEPTTSRPDRRDQIGRAILAVCSIGALAAAGSLIGAVADGEGELRVAETWQLAGLPVFAGLFAVLAVWPRRTPGLWELVIANKAALTIAGLTFLSDTDGGSDFATVDGTLVALLAIAYVLTRGWTAWSAR